MPWYLYIALKQLFPSGRFFSLYSFLSVAGVTMGVWMLVVVQSVMNGFGEQIRSKLIDTGGHVQIESGDIIYNAEEIIAVAKQIPGVEAAAPYAQGMVMLQHLNRPAVPAIRGLDVQSDESVLPLDQYMLVGDLDTFGDGDIVLGSGLARSLQAYVGSTVDVYTLLMMQKLKADEVLLPEELTVAGIFETGYGHIDSNTVIVTLRMMQDLYGLEKGVHGVALRLTDREQAATVAATLNNTLESPNYAFTWLDANQSLLFIIGLEKTMMFLIVIVISIVAAFCVAVSVFTNVLRKTKEIGLYGALGGSPKEVAYVFALQSFIVGIVGTVLGIVLALIFLSLRDQIIGFLGYVTGGTAALVQFYGFESIPVHYSGRDFVLIIISTMTITTLAGLVPAFRAARLKPAEALRSE